MIKINDLNKTKVIVLYSRKRSLKSNLIQNIASACYHLCCIGMKSTNFHVLLLGKLATMI